MFHVVFSCAFVMPLFVRSRYSFGNETQKSGAVPRRAEKFQTFPNTSLKDRPDRPPNRHNNNLEVDFV